MLKAIALGMSALLVGSALGLGLLYVFAAYLHGACIGVCP